MENEAFDRYMQNVDLLEEVLAVKSLDENVPSALESNPTTMESNEAMIPGLKLQLRSNSMRSDGLRMRILLFFFLSFLYWIQKKVHKRTFEIDC